MTHEALIDANDSNDAPSDVTSYGDYLRRSREALGFSIDEVAIELHLARDVVMHMEQETLASLPAPIFVRGYLRAYAKLVQADPEQVIHAFNKVCAPDDNKKLNLGKHIVIKEMKSGGEKPMRWVSYIIFIGLIVLLLMWWHGHNSQMDNSDNGTMAALATLKPVSDTGVSSMQATQTGTSAPSGNTTGSAAMTAATGTTTTNNNATSGGNATSPATTTGVGQAVGSIPNPNVIVNTNVQNLAPNGSTATTTAGTASTSGGANTMSTQSGQTLANTPTPVVGATSASVSSAASNTSGNSAKPKTKAPAASTWRNPDLQ